MYLNVIFYPIFIIIFNIYFCFHLKLKVLGIVISFVLSKMIITWFFIYKTLFSADWTSSNKYLHL